MSDTARPTETQAWQALKAHYEEIKNAHLRQLFADDPAWADLFLQKVPASFWITPRIASRPGPSSFSCNSPGNAAWKSDGRHVSG